MVSVNTELPTLKRLTKIADCEVNCQQLLTKGAVPCLSWLKHFEKEGNGLPFPFHMCCWNTPPTATSDTSTMMHSGAFGLGWTSIMASAREDFTVVKAAAHWIYRL